MRGSGQSPAAGGGLVSGAAAVQENPAASAAAPSLVSIPDNSPSELKTDAIQPDIIEGIEEFCPNAVMKEGTCGVHGEVRWVAVPCKRRDCPVCGPKGRYEIAKRIAYGVREFWPCAWLVLTFGTVVAEESEWKPKAIKKMGKFITWLRKRNPALQYAATYELTKRGRLHINLIAGPWVNIPQKELQERWGARVWVEWVKDDAAVGREAAKAYSPELLAGYLSKLSQAVPVEWGRRVSFSKGWPKLPEEKPERVGEITWRGEWEMDPMERWGFYREFHLGWWVEKGPGEWGRPNARADCVCFELKWPSRPPGENRGPP